jgi:hypothetical protein
MQRDVLLVCIDLKYIYRQLWYIYHFIILNTRHPGTLYLYEQVFEDPWLFFETKRGPRANKFGKHWPSQIKEQKQTNTT